MILAVTGPDPKEILSDPRAGSQEQLITQLTVMLSSAYAEGTRIFLFNGSEPFGTLAFQTLQNITTDTELTTAFYLPFPDTEQDPTLLSKASFVHWHRTAIPDIPEKQPVVRKYCNDRMVEDCDELLVVYDMEQNWLTDSSETARLIRYASEKQKPISVLNPYKVVCTW